MKEITKECPECGCEKFCNEDELGKDTEIVDWIEKRFQLGGDKFRKTTIFIAIRDLEMYGCENDSFRLLINKAIKGEQHE